METLCKTSQNTWNILKARHKTKSVMANGAIISIRRIFIPLGQTRLFLMNTTRSLPSRLALSILASCPQSVQYICPAGGSSTIALQKQRSRWNKHLRHGSFQHNGYTNPEATQAHLLIWKCRVWFQNNCNDASGARCWRQLGTCADKKLYVDTLNHIKRRNEYHES